VQVAGGFCISQPSSAVAEPISLASKESRPGRRGELLLLLTSVALHHNETEK